MTVSWHFQLKLIGIIQLNTWSSKCMIFWDVVCWLLFYTTTHWAQDLPMMIRKYLKLLINRKGQSSLTSVAGRSAVSLPAGSGSDTRRRRVKVSGHHFLGLSLFVPGELAWNVWWRAHRTQSNYLWWFITRRVPYKLTNLVKLERCYIQNVQIFVIEFDIG